MDSDREIEKLTARLEKFNLAPSKQKEDPQKPDAVEDCPVCILPLKYPVRLHPCGHVFCFLCIKGVCLRSGSCPLCRADISRDLAYRGVTEKELLSAAETDRRESAAPPDSQAYWYYEGYRGWWEYDAATGALIEEAHQSGREEVGVYLFGNKYRIDLKKKEQYREGSSYRVRRIRRSEGELSPSSRKGVAGIFTTAHKRNAED